MDVIHVDLTLKPQILGYHLLLAHTATHIIRVIFAYNAAKLYYAIHDLL